MNSNNNVLRIKNFLETKFNKKKLNRVDFARKSGVPYRKLCHILNCTRKNVNIETVIKIAHYFNCSIEQVLGIDNVVYDEHYTEVNTVLENFNKNLQQFIQEKISKEKINPYILSKEIGFNENVIKRYIDDKTHKITISMPVIMGISRYFNVPIDKMIKRI